MNSERKMLCYPLILSCFIGQKIRSRAEDIAQLVECLLSSLEAQGEFPPAQCVLSVWPVTSVLGRQL